jgi:hypothetical protein
MATTTASERDEDCGFLSYGRIPITAQQAAPIGYFKREAAIVPVYRAVASLTPAARGYCGLVVISVGLRFLRSVREDFTGLD